MILAQPFPIGIVATSHVVPPVEFQMGIDKLKEAGFHPFIHPHCYKRHLYFAGKDEERASAFFEWANNPSFSVLWVARGGFGSARMIPMLEKFTAERGIPNKKLLVGFSDVTLLHEFVRRRWGWDTLHAPMPAVASFSLLDSPDWRSLVRWVRGLNAPVPWGRRRLRFMGEEPRETIEGKLVGGNLTRWSDSMGTPYAHQGDGKILFFEDVSEKLYRLHQRVTQIEHCGGFRGVKGIILGEFADCEDSVQNVLQFEPSERARARMLTHPQTKNLAPLRPRITLKKGLTEIFGYLHREFGIPVAYGLPVGHGTRNVALPLGAEVKLTPEGELSIVSWEWLQEAGAHAREHHLSAPLG